jgi:hypothetical protein
MDDSGKTNDRFSCLTDDATSNRAADSRGIGCRASVSCDGGAIAR